MKANQLTLSVQIRQIIAAASGILARLCRDSAGKLWLVYQGGTSIYVKTSADGGLTWSDAELVVTEDYSGVAYGITPDIVVDSNDVPHIVYSVRTGTTTQRKLYYTNRIGGTWSEKEDMLGQEEYMIFPRIAIDSSDDIHVIYHGVPTTYKKCYVKRTSGVWGAEYVLDTISAFPNIWSHDIAIDSNDYIHTVFASRRGRTVYYRKYTDSWQPQVALFTTDNYDVDQFGTKIAIDGNDDAHIVWSGHNEAGTYPLKHNIRYIKQVSGVWQSIEELTDVDSHQVSTFGQNAQIYNLNIAINALGEIDIVWYGGGHNTNPGAHIKYDGSWSAIDTPINPGAILYRGIYDVLWHKHPSDQGILEAGYMVMYASALGLMFYEGG